MQSRDRCVLVLLWGGYELILGRELRFPERRFGFSKSSYAAAGSSLGEGYTSALLQVSNIVAWLRLEGCDGCHSAIVMITGVVFGIRRVGSERVLKAAVV